MGGSRSSSNVTEEGSSQHRATGTLTLTGGFQVKNDRTESGGREGEIRWGEGGRIASLCGSSIRITQR